MAEPTSKLSLSESANILGLAGKGLITDTPYLLPDVDVTRSFTNADDAVTYMQGREFQRRFNPNQETHLGIRADFQGVDRDARLPQAVLDEQAAQKVAKLRQSITPASTEAEILAVEQQINQVQNRAWYSKRFYTDLNAPTGVKDVKYYLKNSLRQPGMFADSSRLTVLAGSNPAEVIPLAGQQAFGGLTTDFKTGQHWMPDIKKRYNFPQLIASSTNLAPEARAASYLSTNPASELFPTADAIAKYSKQAGTVDIDRMAIDLEGRMQNPLVYGMKPVSPAVRLAGRGAFYGSLLLDAPENYYTAGKRQQEQERTKAGANWYDSGNAIDTFVPKTLSLSDKLKMAKDAVIKSAVSGLTFGASSAGTGASRPTRGMSQIGQERGGGEVGADESRRALIERSKNWTPK